MPVITPAYPSMCATYNITKSTMGVIQKEIDRGLDITLAIMSGNRPWSDMFTKHTFFTKDYKYYMSVISASKTEEQHRIWAGWVESRARLLVAKLERAPGILHARPFVKSFERRHKCKSDEELRLVQDGSLDFLAPPEEEQTDSVVKQEAASAKAEAEQDNSTPQVDGSNGTTQTNGDAAQPSITNVITTTQYIGLELDPGMSRSSFSAESLEVLGVRSTECR